MPTLTKTEYLDLWESHIRNLLVIYPKENSIRSRLSDIVDELHIIVRDNANRIYTDK